MRILVLNGSPRGNDSVTLETVKFFEKYFNTDVFEIENVGQKIHSYYADKQKLMQVVEKIQECDIIMFCYPVYTFLVPAQLQRFIELLSQYDLKGKCATQISTSKHFFDMTAHKFIEQRCYDLGLNYIRGFSADMEDLTKYAGRKQAYDFYKSLQFAYINQIFEPNCNNSHRLLPQYTQVLKSCSKNEKRTVIITNATPDDHSLNAMLSDYVNVSKTATEIINLNSITFSAGCLGCLRCAQTGNCIQKDGFEQLLKQKILTADATVFALKIIDHSFGSQYKTYTDRQFCNGHRTLTVNMPVGFIIEGDYFQEQNVQILVEGTVEVANNVNVGIVTQDEHTAQNLEKLALGIDYALTNKPTRPQNYYGVGGMRIFRDLIYQMRGIMPLDHKFYKSHKIYDTLPTKHKGQMLLMKLLGVLLKSGKIKPKMFNDGMLMAYKKALSKTEKFD